jgi:hypothetical protein
METEIRRNEISMCLYFGLPWLFAISAPRGWCLIFLVTKKTHRRLQACAGTSMAEGTV